MQYPVILNFKILAVAPQIFIRDASGAELMYVKQKLFKLKEVINVFADQSQTTQLYSIKADRIIDFSPRYNFTDNQGLSSGAIKRQGMRSLWKAHYNILDGDTPVFQIQEENPFVKFMDALFGEIPIIGIFSGYVFNPVYLVRRPGETGETVIRLTKKRSFFESNFTIEKVDLNLSEREERIILLSILTAVLLERSRG